MSKITKKCIRYICEFWRSIIIVAVPLILSPLVILSDSEEAKCGYVMMIMAAFWMTEAVPTAVTSLIPVFAFPLLGLMSTGDVSRLYMKGTIMMFLGGLMVAIAVEQSNLHKRIALFVILKLGQSPLRLTAGFMLTTMVLSMWISNTASTAMMVPIVDAILQEFYVIFGSDEDDTDDLGLKNGRIELLGNEYSIGEKRTASKTENVTSDNENFEAQDTSNRQQRKDSTEEKCHELTAVPPNERCRAFKDLFFLATAYGANLGGTGSITGTGPNLVLRGLLLSQFNEKSNLNFASWMLFNVPGMLVCGALTYIWLYLFFIGLRKKSHIQHLCPEKKKAIKRTLQRKAHDMGPMTFNELVVLFWFTTLVLLWFFRSPGFMKGWGDLLMEHYGSDVTIGDATPALFIAFILFCIPSKPNFLCFRDPEADKHPSSSPGCLTWKDIQEKIPWGVLLLVGGGLALAKGAQESGLSSWLGQQLQYFEFMPPALLLFCICLFTAAATEITSNTATASVLLPILKDLSLGMCLNPLYLMLSATLCCSFAFMLPVATPPNAIVFGAANIDMRTMMKAGLVPNLLCVLVVTLSINTYGILVFDIKEFPGWANSSVSGFQPNC